MANGDAPVVGDGNGDGVKDSQQNNVASLTFLQTPTAQSNPGNAPVTPISLVADSLAGKGDPDASTAVVTRLEQQDAPAGTPAELQMPLGLLSFTVSLQANANADSGPVAETFSLYVDPNLGANGYWVQNADGIWCNLASAAYGGQAVLEGGKLRLDFQLLDGGEFDIDGVVNGSIENLGAVANMPLSLVGFAQDVPEGGFWF